VKPKRWRKIEESYHLARERGLAALSGSDLDVRYEVERLLAHDKGNDFLDPLPSKFLLQRFW
jgi:hypothetical protein